MNIVFMGTPDFAVPTLEMLIKEGHSISCVVTQPDKAKGRGKKLSLSPVKEVALAHHLPILQPERIKGDEAFLKHIQSLNPDVIIVVAFGQILPETILKVPKYGCINIHGSLLPKYRGAAPIQWAILNEEAITGVTIMYMDKGMDTGDMILKKEVSIEDTDTYETLQNKMKETGAVALKEALSLIVSNKAVREKQEASKASYAPMIEKSLGNIDWNTKTHAIDAKIRGLNPWPGGYTYYQDEVMKIWKAVPYDVSTEDRAGTILEVTKEGILVKTGDSGLLIQEIQMPNKKRLTVSEYIKGNTIKVGVVLGKE